MEDWLLQFLCLFFLKFFVALNSHLNRPIPSILLTADVTPEAEAKARIVGIDRFLTKPITADGLLDAVERAVGHPDFESECLPNESATHRLGQTGNTAPTSESVARVRSVLRPDMLTRISQISSTAVPIVINTFIRDVESGMDRIRKTIASEDWEGIKEAVHRLKGATTLIGADRLTDLYETMHCSADRRDRVALQACFESVQAAQTQVIESMKEHFSRRHD